MSRQPMINLESHHKLVIQFVIKPAPLVTGYYFRNHI